MLEPVELATLRSPLAHHPWRTDGRDGEAPLGIVYQTDAAADKGVKIVGAFPESSHPPIIYPIAVTMASTNPDAAAYIGFLKSPSAKPAFEKQGFVVLQ